MQFEITAQKPLTGGTSKQIGWYLADRYSVVRYENGDMAVEFYVTVLGGWFGKKVLGAQVVATVLLPYGPVYTVRGAAGGRA